MMTTKDQVWCKLKVQSNIIEQLVSFKCMGIIITSSKNLTLERHQLLKDIRISDYLQDII